MVFTRILSGEIPSGVDRSRCGEGPEGVLLESELSLKAWASRKFEFKSGNGVIELAHHQAPQFSGFRKRKPLLKAQRECPQHKSTERKAKNIQKSSW